MATPTITINTSLRDVLALNQQIEASLARQGAMLQRNLSMQRALDSRRGTGRGPGSGNLGGGRGRIGPSAFDVLQTAAVTKASSELSRAIREGKLNFGHSPGKVQGVQQAPPPMSPGEKAVAAMRAGKMPGASPGRGMGGSLAITYDAAGKALLQTRTVKDGKILTEALKNPRAAGLAADAVLSGIKNNSKAAISIERQFGRFIGRSYAYASTKNLGDALGDMAKFQNKVGKFGKLGAKIARGGSSAALMAGKGFAKAIPGLGAALIGYEIGAAIADYKNAKEIREEAEAEHKQEMYMSRTASRLDSKSKALGRPLTGAEGVMVAAQTRRTNRYLFKQPIRRLDHAWWNLWLGRQVLNQEERKKIQQQLQDKFFQKVENLAAHPFLAAAILNQYRNSKEFTPRNAIDKALKSVEETGVTLELENAEAQLKMIMKREEDQREINLLPAQRTSLHEAQIWFDAKDEFENKIAFGQWNKF